MTRIKAVLFDCDGVLLDSEPMGCGALAQALTNAGFAMTMTQARDIFSGNSSQDSRNWIAAQGLAADEIFRESDRLLFEMFERGVPLIPGVEHILASFPLAMAICSNASIDRLSRSVCKTPIAARFGRHVYSADHVALAKPAPDLALHACREIGISPADALFIDDNTHGIECAKTAGCLAVGFIAPNDDRIDHAETLQAAGADYIVHGMDEFHALLTFLTAETLEDA